MTPNSIEERLYAVIDALASVEHERWSHWQRYMHNCGIRQADGSLLLPRDLVDHWEKQIRTRYADLSETEKESDRQQVRKYLPVIISALTSEK